MYPFRKWIDFIKIKGVDYFFGLFKIGLTAITAPLLILLAVLLVFGGVGYLIGPDNIINLGPGIIMLSFVVLMIVGTVFFLILYWIMSTLQLTSVPYTDSMFFEKKFSIWETFSRIKYKVLKLFLAMAGIYFLVYLPVLILLVFMIGVMVVMFALSYISPELSAILVIVGIILYVIIYLFNILYALLMYVFYAVFGFVSQFWALELFVGKRPVLEALKQSFRIVKANLLETFLFNVIWMFVAGILSIPLIVFFIVMYIAPYLAPVLLKGFGLLEAVMISGAALLVSIFLMLVFVVLVLVFSLPTQYLFWIKARKRIK